MATKSTNSEREKTSKRERMPGIFAMAVLILSATIVFLLQYPGFKERAAEEEPNILAGSEFLHEIYQGNIVLYKQLCDYKASKEGGGENASAQDFFLSAEIKRAKDFGEYYDFGGKTPLSYAGEQLDELLYQWYLAFQNGIDQQIDYELIDRESGRTFSNTERALHYLGTEEEAVYLDDYYPYYIKLDFDESGILEHVWVRGEDADALVESVQRVMRSRYLERSLYESLSYSAYGGIDWEDAIYYQSSDYNAVMQMTVQVLNTPKNCTICYALTETQLADVKASSRMFLSMSTAGNYRNSGIQDVFRLLLIILGITAMLLPFWKKYHLHEQGLLPLHIEVLTLLTFATFLILGELSVTLVRYSLSDSWEYSLSHMLCATFPVLTKTAARDIVWVINFLFLAAAFTLWFTLITAYAQVYVFGLRGYVRKRCLCYRVFRYTRASMRRKRARIKREFLHMDMEQNMNVPLFKALLVNYLVLAVISMFWALGVVLLIPYTVFLYGLLRKYIRLIQGQYTDMLTVVRAVAEGNLQTEMEGDWGIFSAFQEELSAIQSGFSDAVEEEVKSQRMRTELITNVSHDLKTPLTAIITYTELLQEEGVTETQRKEYLEVLKRKSLRLKTLIEDLFEVSKANSGNVAFHTEKVDICHLVRQMYLEYEDKAKDAGLIFRFQFPEQKVFLMLDGEKTSRVFDNLYTNIIKYAMPDSRVYVSVTQDAEEVRIELKNISGYELNIPAESLTERFVRGDSSRSSEGSGLGLAIARSFVELQGGKMDIEIDGDLFKVTLTWKGL
ncbi:MAG: HAMP domain-containing sensor histidine kinase [Lachnospiraceae bacterium]|nr:HAMP domain-containing sensor histidine kinase [Lachnospiraceae bacterium]